MTWEDFVYAIRDAKRNGRITEEEFYLFSRIIPSQFNFPKLPVDIKNPRAYIAKRMVKEVNRDVTN